MPALASRPVIAALGTLAVLALAACGSSNGWQDDVKPNVAMAALSAGDPQLALHTADLILARHPHDPAALAARGDALYALHQPDAARDSYRAAIQQDPGNAAALLGLGRTLLHSDPKAAEAAFLAASRLQPDNAVALNDLGVARDLQQNHAGAQAEYRAALAVAPGSTATRINLGLSQALSGDAAEAVATLRPLQGDAGARPIWRANLAVALAMKGDVAEARALLASQDDATASPPPASGMPQASHHPPTSQPPPVTPPSPGPTARSGAPLPSAASGSPAVPPPAAPAPGAAVQLASVPAQQDVAPTWQRLQARFAALQGRTLSVVTGDVNGRTWWRLRIAGFANLADARALCRQLTTAGAACLAIAPPRP